MTFPFNKNSYLTVRRNLIAVFLLSLISMSIAVANTVPLDHFVKHGDYLDLKLSPDGQHLAGRIRQNGGISLVIFNLATLDIVGGLAATPSNEIHTVTWVNNERIVFELAQKYNHWYDRPVSTGELYGVNIDGTKRKLLYGYRAGDGQTGRKVKTRSSARASQEVISVLKSDLNHILITEYPWATKSIPMISKLNVYSGKKSKIERIPYHRANILADKEDGSVRFISWYDKKNVVHAATRNGDDDNWEEVVFDDDFGSDAKPVQMSDDGSKVYWQVDLGAGELSVLREMDLKNKQTKTLFTSSKVDLSFWESDIENNEPAVGVFYPGFAKYQYAEKASTMKNAHRQMVKAFNGQNVFIKSHSDDGLLLLVSVTSDVNPGEYYLFNRKTKQVNFLWANRSWIDPRQMLPMKNLSVSMRDGTQIHALITLPESAKTTPASLVVVPHGGPHGARDYWDYNDEVQLLANRGHAVLQVNFRGSDGFGDAFLRQGHREWGGLMIEDIIDATKHAIGSENIDPNKVCVYGASYGGYAAMMSAAKAPSLFRCAVGYVGVYDLNIMYSDGDIPDFWGGEEYLEKVIGRDQEVLRESSPISFAADITADVMLIHGMEDKRVPVKHAKEMRKAFNKVGKKIEWLTYGGSGHGVYEVDKRIDMYTKLLAFFEKSFATQ
ncbi:MAG: dipeptidyl aminopeptidase/acylaminoacyl peptidase [Arenicella sp.]